MPSLTVVHVLAPQMKELLFVVGVQQCSHLVHVFAPRVRDLFFVDVLQKHGHVVLVFAPRVRDFVMHFGQEFGNVSMLAHDDVA